MRPPVLSKCLGVLLLAGLWNGCRHLESGSSSPSFSPSSSAATVGSVETLNNAASLLYDLFNDEKNLSKLLIVKRETDELDKLVKTIASFAAAGIKELKQLSKADPSRPLEALALPAGEVATRKAIAKTTANSLLRSSGADFEFKLLLTQVEALNYGVHLARVAAEHEPNAERSRRFSDLSAEMERLHQDTLRLLQARAAALSRRP